ncbi:hypothetical protein BH10BDE1_BH10BDE1_13920 [soil metagenome]
MQLKCPQLYLDVNKLTGDFSAEAVKQLKLPRAGSSADAIHKESLAPLIRPGMKFFEELKRDIVDPFQESN